LTTARRPRLAARLGLAAASVLGFLVLLEVVLRATGFVHMPAIVPMMVWNPVEDLALRSGTGLFVEDRAQLWVPRPGATPLWAPDERINAAGYRGPELSIERIPGVVRIAALGDSSTFGLPVDADEAWPARLAFELDSRGIRCEVLNAGVVGYTVSQGIERYLALVRPYRPDIVVAAFGAYNDHLPAKGLPDHEKIARRKAYSALKRLGARLRVELRVLHLVGLVGERLAGLDRDALRGQLRELRRQQRELEEAIGRPDYAGQRRVDLQRFAASLRELDALVRADGAKLVLVAMPRHPEKEEGAPILLEYDALVHSVGAELGVPVFDFKKMVIENMAMGRKWEELFRDHFHPSPRGHAMFAKGLVHKILPLL
jgi:lysophospholipase L1-like esterase